MKRSLDDLNHETFKIRAERDWKKFRTPKDLSATIVIESVILQKSQGGIL